MVRRLVTRYSAEIVEVAPVGRERVLAGAALGREHVEEQLDQGVVGVSRRAGHRQPSLRYFCFENRSGGIDTVISRGGGS